MRFLNWQIAPETDARQFLEELNPFVKPKPLEYAGSEFRRAALSFFPDHVCYAVTLPGTKFPESTLFALYKPGEVMIMNWTNEPIYRVAEKAPIQLDKHKAVDYAKFFFDFVRGQHGRFIIVERTEQIPWLPAATPFEQDKVREMLMPVTYRSIGRDNRYLLVATVLFKNALFRTNIRVAPDGLMELTDEELLLENLQVPIDPPLQSETGQSETGALN